MEDKSKNFSWRSVLKAVFFFLEEDKKKFIFYFFVLLIIFFYDFLPIFLVGKIVDFFSSYKQGDSLSIFYFYALFCGATWIAASLIRLYSKKALNIMSQRARARARIWGFEKLTEFSLSWHNNENTGAKLQRIFTGADAIRSFMGLVRKDLLKIGANITGVIIAFIFIDWRLFVFVLVYAPVFLYIEFTFSKKVFRLSNEFNKLNQLAGGVYVEGASNMLSIKALGSEKGVIDRVSNREIISRDISIKKTNANNLKWRLLQVVNGVSLSVFLFIIGFTLIANIITVGMVLVLYTYFRKLQDSLTDISDLHTELVDLRSDIGQIMPIFEEVESIKTGDDKFPENWESFTLSNIFMDYKSGQQGLNNFNLKIKNSTKIGIAGLSGSGKSTLAKVILGLYPIKSGELRFDNFDYYSISHKEVLKNITVVLQETELFNLSLRDNITMLREEDGELLKEAIETSQLKNVIDRLPEGLDSKIGEKGYMLSGGERQRLGIARAVYKNAPIVILDEATSSLDSETENKIMGKLLEDNKKTFIIIAHRLGTLKYTDSISVVEQGRVAEEGSYEFLMVNKESLFYKLNTQQHKNKEK